MEFNSEKKSAQITKILNSDVITISVTAIMGIKVLHREYGCPSHDTQIIIMDVIEKRLLQIRY